MLLEFDGATKRYLRHAREIVAIEDVSFDLEEGETLCLLGSARSGKSTLLRLAAGLELPDDGAVRFMGRTTAQMSRRTQEQMLRHDVGCVWQQTVRPAGVEVTEFVAWPLISAGLSYRRALTQARASARRVSVDDCCGARLDELSASESMRVCIAQALVRGPRLLVADEPSKTLDPIERKEVVALLQSVTRDAGVSLLMTAGDASGAVPFAHLASLDRGRLLMRPRPSAQVVPLAPRRAHG